jgi:predicted secreted hydrolase
MAHMAMTDDTARRFVYGEKRNRAALGLTGASAQGYHVWNEDWRAEWLGAVQQLAGDIPGYTLNLIVTP